MISDEVVAKSTGAPDTASRLPVINSQFEPKSVERNTLLEAPRLLSPHVRIDSKKSLGFTARLESASHESTWGPEGAISVRPVASVRRATDPDLTPKNMLECA